MTNGKETGHLIIHNLEDVLKNPNREQECCSSVPHCLFGANRGHVISAVRKSSACGRRSGPNASCAGSRQTISASSHAAIKVPPQIICSGISKSLGRKYNSAGEKRVHAELRNSKNGSASANSVGPFSRLRSSAGMLFRMRTSTKQDVLLRIPASEQEPMLSRYPYHSNPYQHWNHIDFISMTFRCLHSFNGTCLSLF